MQKSKSKVALTHDGEEQGKFQPHDNVYVLLYQRLGVYEVVT